MLSDINSSFLDNSTGMYTKLLFFISVDRYADPDNSWNGTECSQSMPLFLGVAPEYLEDAIYQILLADIDVQDNHIVCGMFGIKWLLMTLSERGGNSIAAKLVLQDSYPSYGYMLDMDASTIWVNLHQ